VDAGMQLLLLYVLGSQVHSADTGIYSDYLSERHSYGKNKCAKKKEAHNVYVHRIKS
jgi:hypothetical protein